MDKRFDQDRWTVRIRTVSCITRLDDALDLAISAVMDGGGLTTRTVCRWCNGLDARVLPLISDDADDVGYDFTTSLDPDLIVEMEIFRSDKISVVQCDTRDSDS